MSGRSGGHEGKGLGVLFASYVDKQNPFSHAFKRRFLVLTQDMIYWFLRSSEANDLFGVERGRMSLSAVLTVRVLDEDLLSFELQSTDFNKRIFKCSTEAQCEEWISAVRSAVKRHHQDHYSTSHGDQEKRPAAKRRMSLSAAFLQQSDAEDEAGDMTDSADVSVLVVSHRAAFSGVETVLARNPAWRRLIRVPHMARGDEILCMMSNGGLTVLTQETLLLRSDIGAEFEAPVQNVLLSSSLKVKCTIEGDALSATEGIETEKKANSRSSRLTSVLQPVVSLCEGDRGATALVVLVAMVASTASRDLCCRATTDTPGFSVVLLFSLSLAAAAVWQLVRGKATSRVASQQDSTHTVCVWLTEHQFKSPDAPVMEPEEEIPQRFINAVDGDLREARRRWDVTRKFREENRVDDILTEEQPHFFTIKTMWPHYVCGRGREGHPVWLERPGDIEVDQLNARGITPDVMLRHWLFITEYLWRVTAPDPMAKSITVIDIGNLKMGDMVGDNLDFIKKMIAIANVHYPERAYVMFVVNAPSWFSFIWKLVKPMVHENTQKKVRILSKKEILPGLLELVDISQIPIYYGGQCDYGGGIDSCRFNCPDEVQLAEFVRNIGKVPAATSGDVSASSPAPAASLSVNSPPPPSSSALTERSPVSSTAATNNSTSNGTVANAAGGARGTPAALSVSSASKPRMDSMDNDNLSVASELTADSPMAAKTKKGWGFLSGRNKGPSTAAVAATNASNASGLPRSNTAPPPSSSLGSLFPADGKTKKLPPPEFDDDNSFASK